MGAFGVLAGGVRGRAVDVLSSGRRLTAKQVFEACRRGGSSYSYQAVHKALRKLERDGVVFSEKCSFFLSEKWLESALRKLGGWRRNSF